MSKIGLNGDNLLRELGEISEDLLALLIHPRKKYSLYDFGDLYLFTDPGTIWSLTREVWRLAK